MQFVRLFFLHMNTKGVKKPFEGMHVIMMRNYGIIAVLVKSYVRERGPHSTPHLPKCNKIFMWNSCLINMNTKNLKQTEINT